MSAFNSTTQNCQVPQPKTFDAGQIFRKKPSGIQAVGYDIATPNVPVIDNLYSFAGWQADLVVWWINFPHQPLYIYGPAGCGKTSGLKQIAARLNYPVWEVTGYDSMQPIDLEGCQSLTAQNGITETQWLYGPLAQAMRAGGLFIFNEMDMASPGALVALNTILDGSPLVIESTGEVVRPAPMFRFTATGNSNGSGDDSGAYTGVMRQNFALQDRFMFLEAKYMEQKIERRLLMQHAPQLPDAVIGQMMEFVTLVRQAAQNEATNEFAQYNDMLPPMSTRALLRWAQTAEVYAPAAQAGVNVLGKSLDLAFANSKDKGQRNALQEILQRITNND